MDPATIEAACNEACKNVAELVLARKEGGLPLPTSEILAIALQRLLSYGVTGSDWQRCLEYLSQQASDKKWEFMTETRRTTPMSKDELLSYCYENEDSYIRDTGDTVREGQRTFDCLIELVEDGTVTSMEELETYGMNY